MPHTLSLRIGTRSSLLALAQAETVRARLRTLYPTMDATLVPMSTTGDVRTDVSLAEIGGKGLFTRELEESLRSGRIDMAVHSLKDMETHLAPGMTIAAVLEREDPRDALIARDGLTFAQLPSGASVATSAMRRAAILRRLRPDLRVLPMRGNITTRLQKLDAGEADALILALAGLRRIKRENRATEILPEADFIPAAGQGMIAVECLEDNAHVRALLQPLIHAPSWIEARAERSLLATLDGSCRTPIGSFACFKQGRLHLRGMLADPEGAFFLTASGEGEAEGAEALGIEVGKKLLIMREDG
jgi:hydroxymethylbilane synthase